MRIKLSEKKLHRIVQESVSKVLTELDWKTYMNAAKARKSQGLHKQSDDLMRHAQDAFQRKHGKDGHKHQYEGPYTSFHGKNAMASSSDDSDFDVKAPWEKSGDEMRRRYRYGNGTPYLNGGSMVDITLDRYKGEDEDGPYTRDVRRKHSVKIDKDGEHYDPYNSTVGDEVSQSQDDGYNKAWDDMSKDMQDYYSGRSRYSKGKGWED